ncbi:MAG: serine/threonine-protein kinase [Planctomycetota bacterium]
MKPDGKPFEDSQSAEDTPTLPPGPTGANAPEPQDTPTIVVESNGELGSLPPSKVHPSAREFGSYELLEEIARGGMGVVFKAREKTLNRIVALKMILTGQLAGKEDVQRFRAEAEAAARLDHAGIVPIYEIGQVEDQHYFAMSFIDGKSLAERMTQGPLPPREAAKLIRKICLAMAYAHGRGVIHRDLKPANVLVDADGQPKVTDFGLAKQTASDSNLTGTGQILGTPAYMPPEQAAGKSDEIGPLADVYSIGAMLYALLSGRPPFQAATPIDTLRQVLDRDPVSLTQCIDRSGGLERRAARQ